MAHDRIGTKKKRSFIVGSNPPFNPAGNAEARPNRKCMFLPLTVLRKPALLWPHVPNLSLYIWLEKSFQRSCKNFSPPPLLAGVHFCCQVTEKGGRYEGFQSQPSLWHSLPLPLRDCKIGGIFHLPPVL